AECLQPRCMKLEGGHLGRRQIEVVRNQEQLAGWLVTLQPLQDAVEQHALVCRVLVDQDRGIRSLGHQIAMKQLAHVGHRGEARPIGLWRDHRLRGRGTWSWTRHYGRLPQLEQRPAAGRPQLVQGTLPKGVVTGPFERREDGALIAKSNLPLGWMHVHIDLGWIDQQIEHGNRKAVWLAQAAIRLLHREDEIAMLNAPAVDQDDNVLPRAPM